MADITNPQAITFCNQKIRVMADLLETAVETARRIVEEWNSTSMSSLITNTTDRVRDTADPQSGTADGRKPITGQMVHNIINRAYELKNDYEASGNAKLNTVKQVSVNGQARF